MNILVLPALALLATGTIPNRLEGSVGAGAGYDSNLALASSGSSVSSFGSTTLSFWGDGGWALEPSDTTWVYVGARYDGVFCLEAPDLTRQVPGADVSFGFEPTRWLAFTLSPAIGYAFYGDSARNGVRLGARAVVRVRPWRWLSLRVGYARAQSWASDPVFSIGGNRLLTSAEAKLARRTYLAVGYSLSDGDQVFYRSVPSTGSASGAGAGRGQGLGHRGSGRFSQLEPYNAPATENALSVRWEQGVWSELYYTVSYEYTLGHGGGGDYTVHSGFGAVGYRF